MKFSWALLLLLVVGLALPRASQAQVSVYGEGTASFFDDYQTPGNWLEGGTAGVLYDGPTVFKHFVLSADIRTSYVDESDDGQRFISALVGPRLSFNWKKHKLTPYGEFQVGFARYRNLSTSTATVASYSTTDNLYGVNAGVARQLTSRLDVVVDYSYDLYGMNDGAYNPTSVSAGVIFHFVKR